MPQRSTYRECTRCTHPSTDGLLFARALIFRRMQTAISCLPITAGGAGAGKTAALRVLCAELGLSIAEWANPIKQQEYSLDGDGGILYFGFDFDHVPSNSTHTINNTHTSYGMFCFSVRTCRILTGAGNLML